ncbi:MAG: alpha/beta fold hydrolase [Alphaproteobacteria bacterium]|nr:alpha/beta fold hydrolase [Alphaproteobacteria bacterium]
MKKVMLIALICFITENCFGFIVIKKQGSFFVGGKSVKIDGKFNSKDWWKQKGQTRHGDHAYVFFQIPEHSRKYSVVFLHGASQSGKCWETTPDGREGFQEIFLRNGYSTYIVDRPRCGRAGLSLYKAVVDVANLDQFCFDIFRFGLWPTYYKNVQFPKDEKSLKQFFCQTTPNIGAYDYKLIADTVSELFNKIGEGILIAHSQGCESGWYTAMKNRNVRTLILIEPASGFIFPKGEGPGIIHSSSGRLRTTEVSQKEFIKLTRIPIVIYFGDNIPNHPTDLQGQDNWYQRLRIAKLWAKTINKYGGNAEVIHLPKIGIFGNTHFMFMDKNNKKIAKVMFDFLEKKKLNVFNLSK